MLARSVAELVMGVTGIDSRDHTPNLQVVFGHLQSLPSLWQGSIPVHWTLEGTSRRANRDGRGGVSLLEGLTPPSSRRANRDGRGGVRLLEGLLLARRLGEMLGWS